MIKSELRELRYLDIRIDSYIRQIDDLRRIVRTVDYSSNKVQSSNFLDLSSVISKIEFYENKVRVMIDALVDKRSVLQDKVDELGSPYREVLSIYYFEKGSTWESVGRRLNYSVQYVKKLHGDALSILRRKQRKFLKDKTK